MMDKAQTLPTWPDFGPENYQLLVRGSLKQINNNYQLITRSGINYPLKKTLPSLSQDELSWLATPSVDSNGVITNLVLEQLSTSDYRGEDRLWIKAGRIVQLSKTKSLVLIKIKRPEPLKALKIVLREPSWGMAVGQLWSITARLQERYFVIDAAQNLENDPSAQSEPGLGETTKQSITVPLTAPSVSTEKPLNDPAVLQSQQDLVESYLVTETGISQWSLPEPKLRNGYREWNCDCLEPQIWARVILDENDRQQLFTWQTIGANQEQEVLEPVKNQNLAFSVKILGGGRTIGGNCFALSMAGYSILLDCGCEPNTKELPKLEELEELDLVLISHAHPDCLDGIPYLSSLYWDVPIISTPATRELAHLSLFELDDSAKDDLLQVLWRWQTIPAEVEFFPLPGLKVKFINAGHLCGAVAIYLESGKDSLLYTGDFNTTNTRTTFGIKDKELPSAKILLLSGTLGTQPTPARKTQESELIALITNSIARGQKTIVSGGTSFAAIEIFLLLITITTFSPANIPIYLNQKSLNLLQLFEDNLEFLPKSLKNFLNKSTKNNLSQNVHLFQDFNNFFERKTPQIFLLDETDLKRLFADREIFSQINNPQTNFILATLDDNGRKCDYYPPNLISQNNSSTRDETQANYAPFSLLNHANFTAIGQILNKVKPKNLILINGDSHQLEDIFDLISNKEKYSIHIPDCGELIKYRPQSPTKAAHSEDKSVVNNTPTQPKNLPPLPPSPQPEEISSSQISPSEITVHLEAINSQVYILSLPKQLATDPRWQKLLQTPNIQTTFSGANLVFLNSNPSQAIPVPQHNPVPHSCQTCEYFVSQTCQQENSPLFELNVDPDGICSQYKGNNENG